MPAHAPIMRAHLPPRDAAAQVGAAMMVSILGPAPGSWMAGAILDATGSHRAAFVNGIVWTLIPLAMMLLLRARRAPGAPARS